ncbi:hypothetical protein [Albidovulum sediminis]|uniref:Uncharacterized protein n=1 Tax=Albidovulum sediminis TaxID=3066345 RepID=A0ABT2NNQ8_9RHOB|nr:hypothetical protein [Defluviimonas sediminis]MCT8329728.1 hypothetical protein [Defluviimonas sediminis]
MTPSYEVQVIDLNEKFIRILVSNNGASDLLLSSIECMMFFPIDQSTPWRNSLKAFSDSNMDEQPWLSHEETINPVVISYEQEPDLVKSGETKVSSVPFSHAFIAVADSDSPDRVPSICAIDFSGSIQKDKVSTLDIHYSKYRNIDLRKIISEAEILQSSGISRDELLEKLKGY